MLFAPAIHFKGSGFHNTDYGTRRRPVSEDGGSGGGSEGASSNGAGKDAAASSSSGSGGSAGKTVGLDKV